MPQKAPFTPKNYIQANKIIFMGIFMGLIIISIVGIVTNQERSFFSTDLEKSSFMMIIPSVFIGSIAIGSVLFNNLIKTAKGSKNLKTALTNYRTAFIIKLALYEVPALLGAVSFLTEGNLLYLVYTGIAAVLMLTFIPSKAKTIKELDLKGDWFDEFQNSESELK